MRFITTRNALVITLLALFFGSAVPLYANWVAPKSPPPTCNPEDPGCDAPIHTGASSQFKKGSFGVGIFPTATLDVNGQIKIRGGNPGTNKVLTSDASGLASWQTPTGGNFVDTDTLQLVTDRGNFTNKSIQTNGLWSNGNVLIDGSVGIGTMSPTAKLELWGQNQLFYSGTASNNFKTGRNSNENFSFLVSDGDGTITYDQDETDSTNHNLIFNIDSTTAGQRDYIFKNNGTEIVRFQKTGNVGIGTIAPTSKLEVAGRIQATDIKLTNGAGDRKVLTSDANGLASWQTPTGGNTYTADSSLVLIGTIFGLNKTNISNCTGATQKIIWDNTAGTLVCSTDQQGGTFTDVDTLQSVTGRGNTTSAPITVNTGGTSVSTGLTVAQGNVALGSITPTAKLDVDGQIKIRGGTPGTNKVLTSDANGLASWQTPSTLSEADTLQSVTGRGRTTDQIITTAGLWLRGGNAVVDGSVGIGTPAPSATKLDVAGSFRGIADNTYFGFDAGSDRFGFVKKYGSYGKLAYGSTATFAIAQSNTTSILPGSSYTDRLVINSAGNIGIGTSNPATKLTISGSGRGDILRIDNSDYSFSTRLNGEQIAIHNGYTGSGWARNLLQLENAVSSVDFGLGGYGSGQTFTRAYIGKAYDNAWQTWLPNGDVGIGTVAPGAKLDVAGRVQATELKVTGGMPTGGQVLTAVDSTGLARWQTPTGGGGTTYTTNNGLTITNNTVLGLNTLNIATCTAANNKKIVWDTTNNRLNCDTDQTGTFTDTDTLQSVTGRGAITDRSIKTNGLWSTGSVLVDSANGTPTAGIKLEVREGPIKATGGLIIETRTAAQGNPTSPATGRMWLMTQ